MSSHEDAPVVSSSAPGALETEEVVPADSEASDWPTWLVSTWDFLLTYTLLGVFYLLQRCSSAEKMEQMLQILLLTATLVFAMASAIAGTVTRDDADGFVSYCQQDDMEDFRKCLAKNTGEGDYWGVDVCKRPIRRFTTNVTVSHHILGISLVSGVILYVFMTAYGRDQNVDKSKTKKAADWRTSNARAWVIYIIWLINSWILVIIGIVFYLLAYYSAARIHFPTYAWEAGNCEANTAIKLALYLGHTVWIMTVFAFLVMPIAMGLIFGHPRNLMAHDAEEDDE